MQYRAPREGRTRFREALHLHSLITATDQGIASRVLAKTYGGNLTLFAFDAGQELSEHTAMWDVVEALEPARILLLMLRDNK